MTGYAFKPAKRENVGLWINLVGGTGSGKTFSAMRLASGIAGHNPFAVIDTENRRALHYADMFKFDHCELRPPFRPQTYEDAVIAADKVGYPVIVIDSGSHVWTGDGGALDWQEEELDRMAGDDYAKRERVKMAAWIKPKVAHKQMVQKLLQAKAHIILCLRAEQKVEMIKNENGKFEIVPKQSLTGLDGWIPVCEKTLPFEATASFLLLAGAPGLPCPIKLQEQHKSIFPLDKPITEQSGKLLHEWASGAGKSTAAGRALGGASAETVDSTSPESASHQPTSAATLIDDDQALLIESLIEENALGKLRFFQALNAARTRKSDLTVADRYSQIYTGEREAALSWINKAIAEKKRRQSELPPLEG